MRTLDANQTLGQQQNSRTPYFSLVFYNKTEATNYDFSTDSVAYGNRILLIDHTEEPYNDFAYIMLRNNDRAVPDLVGYHVNIGYGDYYSAAAYHSHTSRLWVKEQRIISAGGKFYTLLSLEGIWSFFREQLVIGSLVTDEGFLKRYYDPDDMLGVDINSRHMETMTIFYCIAEIEDLIDAACGTEITLSMEAGQNDGIIDTYVPGQELNGIPYRSAADFVMQLISFTKCFIRVEENQNFEIRYPQSTDAADHTYYSYQQHYFLEYTKNDPLLIPNYIVVLCGQDPETAEWPDEDTVKALAGVDFDQAAIDEYMQVTNLYVSGYIQSKEDADIRADAILYKVDAQRLLGLLVIPHDASVELYDKVSIMDARGT